MRFSRIKGGLRKATAAVMAGAMVTTCMVPVAFGADTANPDVPTKVSDTAGYVTGASPRPPAPGLEMLGISDVECDPANNPIMGALNWEHPKFYLMGTLTYNTNPNPYYSNAIMNWAAGETVATPTTVVGGNSQVRTLTSHGKNPDAAIPMYGTNDGADALWNLKPDVVVGTDADYSDYNGEEYQAAFVAGGITGYSPKSVRYNFSTVDQIIESMYRIAKAADEVVAESNGAKKLRYDETAMEIAQNYEKYSKSLQGYILYRLALDGKEKKTVATVSAYDETSKTYTLLNETSGAQKRNYEVVKDVSISLADKLGTTTVTQEQLASADAIVLDGGLTGDKATSVLANFTDEMKVKTYYNTVGTSVGILYDSGRNSIDTTVEMGRILGCVYNEYVDQDDLVCYWYDEFYHVKTDKIGEVLSKAMAGVRNFDATGSDTTSWTAADAEGYSKANVQAKLNLGTAYVNSMASSDQGALAFVKDSSGNQYMESTTTVSMSDASVSVAKTVSYTGKAVKPAVTVTYAGTKLVSGTDYMVSYSSNTKVGTAKVTVTGKGLFTGTKTASFKIAKASAKITLKAASKTYKAKDVKKAAKSFKIGAKAPTKITYSVSGNSKKVLSVTKSGKVTVKKGAKKGTYKVTVKAASSSKYKAATKTVKVVVK